MRKNSQIPTFIKWVFWSYDVERLNIKRDKELIITQVLNYGDWNSVRWLLKTYSEDVIKNVLIHPNRGVWWKKVLNFWLTVFNLEIRESKFENAVIQINPSFDKKRSKTKAIKYDESHRYKLPIQ